jgi:hypothetical protein
VTNQLFAFNAGTGAAFGGMIRSASFLATSHENLRTETAAQVEAAPLVAQGVTTSGA